MTTKLLLLSPCPGCDQLIPPQGDFCSHCGLDLEGAFRSLQRVLSEWQSGKIDSEVVFSSHRLGQILVKKGYLSPMDLARVLRFQTQAQKEGKHLFIGQMLVDMGYINQQTLEIVVAEQMLEFKLQYTAEAFLRCREMKGHNCVGGPISEMILNMVEKWRQFVSARSHAEAANLLS